MRSTHNLKNRIFGNGTSGRSFWWWCDTSGVPINIKAHPSRDACNGCEWRKHPPCSRNCSIPADFGECTILIGRSGDRGWFCWCLRRRCRAAAQSSAAVPSTNHAPSADELTHTRTGLINNHGFTVWFHTLHFTKSGVRWKIDKTSQPKCTSFKYLLRNLLNNYQNQSLKVGYLNAKTWNINWLNFFSKISKMFFFYLKKSDFNNLYFYIYLLIILLLIIIIKNTILIIIIYTLFYIFFAILSKLIGINPFLFLSKIQK